MTLPNISRVMDVSDDPSGVTAEGGGSSVVRGVLIKFNGEDVVLQCYLRLF